LNLKPKFVDLIAELENIERNPSFGTALELVDSGVLNVCNSIPEVLAV
jgi:hypothetical protein